MILGQVVKRAVRLIDANSPIILTGLAVAGVVSTAIFASRASIEAAAVIKEAETEDNGLWIQKPLQERVQLVWRLYIPAVGMGALTIGSIIGAQSINTRRQAALFSGFAIAERTLEEYQNKNIELNGVETDRKVRDAVQQDRVLASDEFESMFPDAGQVLCFDKWSGRAFKSNKESIRAAQNDINELMLNGEMTASLNEFYGLIGLDNIDSGITYGFSTENLVDINYTSVLTPDGRPCLAIEFRAAPMQDYYRFS